MPWNGSHGSSGTALARPTIPARHTALPVIEASSRTRNGSKRQIKMSTGTAKNVATITVIRKSGKIVSRKATVSASTMRKSKKLAVIFKISNLNRESTINASTRMSERAAAIAGRRNTISQKKLRNPHVSRATPLPKLPYSVE